jgi:Protein of unknown function (DUF2660)
MPPNIQALIDSLTSLIESIPSFVFWIIILDIILYFAFKKFYHSHKKQQAHASLIPIPKKHHFRVITLEESWEFLNRITEAVMTKFSQKDQELVLALGKQLCKIGVIYNHVIEYGVSYTQQDAKTENLKKQRS